MGHGRNITFWWQSEYPNPGILTEFWSLWPRPYSRWIQRTHTTASNYLLQIASSVWYIHERSWPRFLFSECFHSIQFSFALWGVFWVTACQKTFGRCTFGEDVEKNILRRLFFSEHSVVVYVNHVVMGELYNIIFLIFGRKSVNELSLCWYRETQHYLYFQ